MPTEEKVYETHADQYERLVQREDYQGNLLSEIENVISLDDRDIIELGAGTGRLTRLLAPHVRSIRAFDASAHMLEIAEKSLREMNLSNWQIGVADHRHIPIPDASADLVISGWSFSYLAVWGGADWQSALQDGFREIERITRPGGMVILIESEGTGNEKPHPPEHLDMYINWLTETGFERRWIRTDYRFESLTEAVELSTFFFGEKLGQQVRKKNWFVLPECTGIWWRRM